MEAFKNPRRGFDAVVIGEPQRAFYGNQFGLTFPVFVHYGVALWVPEIGGAIDPGSDAHDLVMSLYGGMSKGERNRIKVRVKSAMSAQAAAEGRFLGGRPPYGYVLVDAGPHPNPGKAAHGRQLPGSPLIRSPRRLSHGSSASGRTVRACNGSPSTSTQTASPHRRDMTLPATCTGCLDGVSGASRRSGRLCVTRGTPVAKSGTANAAMRS